MKNLNLTCEGYSSIAFVALLVLLSFIFYLPALIITIPLLALVVWFFRDPPRKADCDESGLVSPADGKVVEIEVVNHPYTGKARKIGIFMDPLNVHVNRVPRSGVVEYMKYVPGKKWMAFAEKASLENERFYMGLNCDCGKIMLVQIAGFLARRIVCRSRKGQKYSRGQRYGMIKLGSKVDVYLPIGVKLKVLIGQKVLAGKTCIGVISHEKKD